MESKDIQNYIETLEFVMVQDLTPCNNCKGKENCNIGKNNICKYIIMKELKEDLEKLLMHSSK